MKTQLISATFCLFSLALPAAAEVFVLKDGTRLEGRILREDDEAYHLEVQITKSIRDEKIVPKSEVEKIEKDRPDERAFEEIAALIPTPDMLPAQEYSQRIAAVEGFLKQYPSSSKAGDAQKILETLKAESAEIAAGGAKLEGKMVPAKEYQANAYELDAQVLEAKIRNLGARSDFAGALKAYGQLQAEFQGSQAYTDILPFMKQLIQSYETQINRLLASYETRVAERKAGLARMSPDDRSNTERALAEEDAQIERRYNEEKAAKQVWVTPHPFHKRSLDDAQRTASQELTKLENPRRPTNIDGGKAYRDAWQAIQGNADPKEVKAALATVRAARIPARYITLLEESAKAAGIEP